MSLRLSPRFLMRGPAGPFPNAPGKIEKMTQHFIVTGPIDVLYHVLYKIPGTIVHNSVDCAESEALAQDECDLLNDEQAKHEQEKS